VKAQLASLTLVNGTSISGALSNVQGYSSRQSSVDVTGRFLLNAKVRVGPSIQNSSSPGFVMSNNTLEFIATAQSLAQFGATIMAAGGVDTPLTARSLCKAADPFGECLAATEIDRR